jgi:hypothetical protein
MYRRLQMKSLEKIKKRGRNDAMNLNLAQITG